MRNELIDLGYNQDDIENRVDYADQNYVSDNAGNIDEMLYKLVTSDSFYEMKKTIILIKTFKPPLRRWFYYEGVPPLVYC